MTGNLPWFGAQPMPSAVSHPGLAVSHPLHHPAGGF